METIDEEFLAGEKDYIQRQTKADKPFFCWFNSTRMHVFTHLKKESLGKTGKGIHADGMVEHDGHVGELLDLLDELEIADNTIVVYSTDNGAEMALWPDGVNTQFKSKKGTTWEGEDPLTRSSHVASDLKTDARRQRNSSMQLISASS